MSDKMPKLLFICQLNAVRSPMAEGLAKRDGFEAESCGLDPAIEPDELMIAVMREKGVDMNDHRSTSLREHTDQPFDHIIAFTDDSFEAAKAVFGSEADIRLWRVPNPSVGNYDVRALMDTYRAIRDVIETRLKTLQ